MVRGIYAMLLHAKHTSWGMSRGVHAGALVDVTSAPLLLHVRIICTLSLCAEL